MSTVIGGFANHPCPGDDSTTALPTRKLGNAGLDISILNLEASAPSDSLSRLLRYAFARGIRGFDTADCYAGSERLIGEWLAEEPQTRTQLLLSTKDHPHAPSEIPAMLDLRLAALKCDHVELFSIHSLGSRHTIDEAIALARSREFQKIVESVKRSGKAKLVGFSIHHRTQAAIISAAADAGIIDVIEFQYGPRNRRDNALNRALDLAHRRGIGLIAMKPFTNDDDETREQPGPRHREPRRSDPAAFQSVLYAVWSDQRIASCSLSMRTTDEIREATAAARSFPER